MKSRVTPENKITDISRPKKISRYRYIRSVHGYRVQLFCGDDRMAATKAKVDFMRRYSGVPAYMTYTQPSFRVKAGNFKNRTEASHLLRQLRRDFPCCMVVPDIVEIYHGK